MHPKFMLLRLRVIVLSILLVIEVSLVPAMQTGIYGQLLQQQQLPAISIKITSPSTGQQVPVGQLTISGRSTDNTTSDCTVYADWNNTKPFQKATATGPDGVNDYSTWSFTYTDKYHLITNGTNNLTSKLSCFNNNGAAANITKSYSVNVIGVAANTTKNMIDETVSTEGRQQPPESFTIDTNNTTAISNETTTVVKEQGIKAKDNVSSLTSIPIPLVANNFAFDKVNVNITSPKSGQQVPVGNLTIAGHSSDNTTNDCTVYTNWNGQNPLQITKALGPGGVNDYSTWSFTYTPAYHAITNGTNELTAQISCLDDDSNNNNNTTAAYLTNYYRVNVTGITEASSSSERTTSSEEQKEQTDGVGSRIPIPIPSPLPSSPPSTQKQEEEDKDVEKKEPQPESEPQPEPEPEPKPEPQPQAEPETEPQPEDNDDTTIYWDIEDAEDSDKNDEQILDFEDNIFDLQ
jgi:hypothetical protein